MKKMTLILVAAAALAGCATQAELDAMSPEDRAARAASIRSMTEQLNTFGKDAPRTKMTNCVRTVSGVNCSTY